MQSTTDNAILISEQIKTSQKTSSLLKVYLPKKKMRKTNRRRKRRSFLKITLYLEEHDNEQITVGELVSKMKEFCGEESYSMKFMKKRVMEHFGDDVIIKEINGGPNVVTFRSTAASILQK